MYFLRLSYIFLLYYLRVVFTHSVFHFLTRSKTVVPHHSYCHDLPRSAPQVPPIPGYPPCCRGTQIVKNVTKMANRGKTGQVDAVKHSRNWGLLLLRLPYFKLLKISFYTNSNNCISITLIMRIFYYITDHFCDILLCIQLMCYQILYHFKTL